jgi:hypothetical protein
VTDAGLALLGEFRWLLGSNESHGYAILSAYRFATRDRSPGPLLRVTSRSPARVGFDPDYVHPRDGDGRDHRKKGRGAKSYVEIGEILGFVDDPDDYERLKAAHDARLSGLEGTVLQEEAEVDAVARHVREKWAARRREIAEEGDAAVARAQAAVKPA